MSSLCTLSDSELVARLPALVQAERHATADVIEHLVEMERRRLYLSLSVSSLYSYCMKNRFREFYADKIDLAHSGTVDADPEERQLTDLELARRIAFVLHEGMEMKRQQEQQQLNA